MKIFSKSLVILLLSFISITAGASVEVLGSLKYIHSAKPGDIVKGEIKIQNNDSTPQEVKIYQTDLMYNLNEQTFYDTPGTNPRSNANWLQYSPKTVVLAAKEIRSIQYEYKIPANDTIKGTYWSILMVEGVTPIDPAEKSDLTIRTVTRYAVQMITELSNRGEGQLKFLEPTIITDQTTQKVYLAVDMTNPGSRYISPDVSVELFDENGESIGTLSAPKKGLFPGNSTRYKINLEGVPSGKTYKAMIVAAGQEEGDVFGLEYTLYF